MKHKAIKVLRYAIANKGIDKKAMQDICGKDYGIVLAYLLKADIGTWGINDKLIHTSDNAELVIKQLRNDIHSSYVRIITVTAAVISAIAACMAAYNSCACKIQTHAMQKIHSDDVRINSTRSPLSFCNNHHPGVVGFSYARGIERKGTYPVSSVSVDRSQL